MVYPHISPHLLVSAPSGGIDPIEAIYCIACRIADHEGTLSQSEQSLQARD